MSDSPPGLTPPEAQSAPPTSTLTTTLDTSASAWTAVSSRTPSRPSGFESGTGGHDQDVAPSASTTSMLALPGSTVVGLGLGFVAAAVAVVMCTVLVRVFQVRRSATRARQNGEDVTFRDMWARWGGWWGMMFSHESPRAPRRFRLHVKHLPRPHLHDAVVGEQKEMFEDSEQPLAVTILHGKEELLGITVLVRMPAPNVPPPTSEACGQAAGEDEDGGLPDVMLGTAFVCSSSHLDIAAIEHDEDKDIEPVVEVEVLPEWQPTANAGPPPTTPQGPAGPHRPSSWGWNWQGMDRIRPS